MHLAATGAVKVALTYAVIRWLHVRWDRQQWRDLSLGGPVHGLVPFAKGLAVGVLLYGLIQGVLWAVGSIAFVGTLWHLTGAKPAALTLAGGAISLLGAAFLEELFFRGYLLQFIRRQCSWKWAVAITSLLFSAMHLLNPTYQGPLPFMAAFLLGCTFALMVRAHGSLWLPIGFHFAWNYTQVYLWQVADSPASAQGAFVFRSLGTSWLNTGAFTAVGSAVEMLVVLLFSGYILLGRSAARYR